MKQILAALLLSFLSGCALPAQQETQSQVLSKDKRLRVILNVENGKVSPSQSFELLDSGRYDVFLFLQKKNKNGQMSAGDITPNFYGRIPIINQNDDIIEYIDINDTHWDPPSNNMRTDSIKLKKPRNKTLLYISGEGLNLSDECKVSDCEIILIFRKFRIIDH